MEAKGNKYTLHICIKVDNTCTQYACSLVYNYCHWKYEHTFMHPHCYLQVVQDFVQTTVDEESPQEWLHRIMDTNSREEGGYDINLLGTSLSLSLFLALFLT